MADTSETTLSTEDAKIVTLARAARARTGAPVGAAVRDLDGRTYAAAAVSLASLEVAALDLAVAMAVSSGAQGLEAGAVLGAVPGGEVPSIDAFRDLAGPGVTVFLADASGAVVGSLSS
ncbi:MAG: cytidine deaminase [Actinomycetales bacterium]|nr:MAG: cytidine deaminase [Actinomycetales bacterium]